MNSALKTGIKKTVDAKAFRILCIVLFYALAAIALSPIALHPALYCEFLIYGDGGDWPNYMYWMFSIIPTSAIAGLFIPDKRKSLLLLLAAGVLYVLVIFH